MYKYIQGKLPLKNLVEVPLIGTIIVAFHNSQKLFALHEYVRILIRLQNIKTPHEKRSAAVPSFYRLERPLWTYDPTKIPQVPL